MVLSQAENPSKKGTSLGHCHCLSTNRLYIVAVGARDKIYRVKYFHAVACASTKSTNVRTPKPVDPPAFPSHTGPAMSI